MVELLGPSPEEMKAGEIYKVVEDKEQKGYRLEKVESQESEKTELFDVEFQLTPIRFHMACIQAFKVGLTYDRWIASTVEELIDQIYDDGPSKY